jgi:putative membrane protein
MMWGYGPYGMMGYGGGWMMLLGGVFWLCLLAVIAFGIMRFGNGCQHGGYRTPGSERRPSGLDILDERYAKGEIQREEYLQKRRDLAV